LRAGGACSAAAGSDITADAGKKYMGTVEPPPIETALVDGDVAFRQHSRHTDVQNWPTFLMFASRYTKAPALRASAR
jgi:hypothetical protein